MTFKANIQRQKSLIRIRNVMRPVVMRREQIIPEYDTEALLEHLQSLKGLNTEERQQFSKIFSHA